MNQEEVRCKLLNGTIQVIAREGLDRASTKQIGKEASVNEAYIYRCFADKEDMFQKAFVQIVNELVELVLKNSGIMYDRTLIFPIRCRQYFDVVWNFFVDNREKCLTYVRYYYSPYFAKYAAEDYKKRFMPVVAFLQPAFKEEADVWMILNHIFNVILDFAVKVHYDQMPRDESYTEHVFRVIYVSVIQYFKESEGKDL